MATFLLYIEGVLSVIFGNAVALFGPILVEWEQYHGLSRSSKAKLIGLTTAIIVAIWLAFYLLVFMPRAMSP